MLGEPGAGVGWGLSGGERGEEAGAFRAARSHSVWARRRDAVCRGGWSTRSRREEQRPGLQAPATGGVTLGVSFRLSELQLPLPKTRHSASRPGEAGKVKTDDVSGS